MWIVQCKFIRAGVPEYRLHNTGTQISVRTLDCYRWAQRKADELNMLESKKLEENKRQKGRKKHGRHRY